MIKVDVKQGSLEETILSNQIKKMGFSVIYESDCTSDDLLCQFKDEVKKKFPDKFNKIIYKSDKNGSAINAIVKGESTIYGTFDVKTEKFKV